MKIKNCEKCNHEVSWRQNKKGKWYLVTEKPKKGHYSTIPHYLECDSIKENMERRAEAFGSVGL